MRSVLVVAILAGVACGSSSRKPAPVVPVAPLAPKPVTKAAPAVTAEAFCDHLEKLTHTCKQLAGASTDRAACEADARSGLADDPQFAAVATCVVQHDDCDEVIDCVAAVQIDPTESLRDCDDDSQLTAEHAVGITQAEWALRNGAGVTAAHDARSTKAAPIEMCGVAAATEWLIALRCDDGSQPIQSIADAEHARPGNVGPGGRCHSIIDRYVVPCPEQPYEIFVDAYICPRQD